MKDITEKLPPLIEQAWEEWKSLVRKLPVPDVRPLNERVATRTVAAVAVDAGQNMLQGVLSEVGIVLLRIGTSIRDQPPITLPFWIDPLRDPDKGRKLIREQLEKIAEDHSWLSDFLQAMGWRTPVDGFPDSAFVQTVALIAHVRDLLEWAMLHHVAKQLARFIRDQERFGSGTVAGLVLRDGALRFASTGAEISERLAQAFNHVGIPVFGVVKRTKVVRHPLLHLWLQEQPNNPFAWDDPFVVFIDPKVLKAIGYRLHRYFGDIVGEQEEEPEKEQQRGHRGMRWGQYVLVRFDARPGSRHLFAVDIPRDMWEDRKRAVPLLTSLVNQVGATVFPWPGYPIPLDQAHRQARLDRETARMFERFIRHRLPKNVAELWDLLHDLAQFPGYQG